MRRREPGPPAEDFERDDAGGPDVDARVIGRPALEDLRGDVEGGADGSRGVGGVVIDDRGAFAVVVPFAAVVIVVAAAAAAAPAEPEVAEQDGAVVEKKRLLGLRSRWKMFCEDR